MPFKKSTASLKKTCLDSICKNFDQWFGINCSTQNEGWDLDSGPFNELPSTLLQDIIESLKQHKRLRRQHLHYLLQPTLVRLDLSYGIGDIYFAMQFLAQRCHNLQRLNVSYQRVSPQVLLQTLECLPCLTILNLSKTICLDGALYIIGRQCNDLTSLNLNLCPISDCGIMNLCFDRENRRTQCQKLAQLFVSETNVTRVGAAFALRTLPNLQELQFDAMFDLFNHPNLLPMKLEGKNTYNILSIHSSKEEITMESLHMVIEICPLISHLSILHWNLSNDALLLISNLTNLTELSLGNGSKMNLTFYEGIFPLLQICGGKLKKLALSQLVSINIMSINCCCPMLSQLALSDISYYELSSSDADTACFTNLKCLKLTSSEEDDIYPNVLKILLSNCTLLQELHVKRCAYFDDSLMIDVLKVNPLPNLRRLVLEECDYATFNLLHELLLLEGNLQTVRIWSCGSVSQNDYRRLLQEAENKNLEIHLDWLGCW